MVNAGDRKRPELAAWAAIAAFTLVGVVVVARRDRVDPKATFPFELEVIDGNGSPVPCRVHLRRADGKVWNASAWPSYDDHFVFSGKASFPMEPGPYSYEVERGPEYRPLRGSFEIAANGPKRLR